MLDLRERLSAGEELRPVTIGDVDDLHAVIAANRAHLRPWMPWADQEWEATATFVQNAVADAAANRALHLAIITNGRIGGCCGFNLVDWNNRSTMLGYWLVEAAQGNGLMTRAVGAMVDTAFSAWDLHRVDVRAAVGNARSRALAERLGFTREGVLRDAEQIAGGYHDLIVYSMLAGEWRDRKPG